jgi:hypothetical protein
MRPRPRRSLSATVQFLNGRQMTKLHKLLWERIFPWCYICIVPLLAAGVPLPHAPAVASCFVCVTHSHNMSWAHTRTRAISCDKKERSQSHACTHIRTPSAQQQAGLRQQPAFKVPDIVGIIEIGGVCRPCRCGSPFHIVMRQCTRTCTTENVKCG